MAGAVGIVFGLCVLSFTLGAALMYVLVRRREDASDKAESSAAPEVPVDARTWVEKPVVEPVEAEYDSRPVHRNPVVGLPQLEPALAVFAEPVVEEPAAEPEPEAEAEPEAEVVEEIEVEAGVESEDEPEVVVETALPPPAKPQAVEQTTWVEREDFRQRYLRTFDEVRRKAGSN